MADAGYLDRDPRYRLAHLKFELRATLNAVLDQDYHTGGLTREAAMTMMTKTAFQEEREAAGKWTRMQLSSAQLPVYFIGYSEWLDLRAATQARPGFNERAFHDAALAHGSPPVRFIRELLNRRRCGSSANCCSANLFASRPQLRERCNVPRIKDARP